jgi:hypothetical protein
MGLFCGVGYHRANYIITQRMKAFFPQVSEFCGPIFVQLKPKISFIPFSVSKQASAPIRRASRQVIFRLSTPPLVLDYMFERRHTV